MDAFTRANSNFAKIYQLVKDTNDSSGKPLILGVFVVAILSLASLFSFKCILDLSWFYGIIALIFWILGYALLINFSVAASYKVNLITIIALALVLFLPVLALKYFSVLLLGLMIGVVLLFFFSTVAMKKQMQLLIKLNWFQIAKKGVIFYTLIFLLTVGFFVYSMYFVKGGIVSIALNKEQFSLKGCVEQVINWLSEQLTKIKIIPGMDLSGTVDDMIKGNVAKQIESLPLLVPSARKAALEQELIVQSREGLEKLTGQKLEGKEKMSEVVANIIFGKWKNFPSSTTTIISIIIFLFLIIPIVTIVNFIFFVLLIPFGWLIFRILLGLKLLKIKKIPIEKEVLAIN